MRRRYSLPGEDEGVSKVSKASKTWDSIKDETEEKGSAGSNGSTSSGLREIKNLDLESLDFGEVMS